jgi:antitoxin (DNA-binding transcriptional repressor) of toxin-antitoxin stability system
MFLQNAAQGYQMQTIAIRELKTNPSLLTKYLEDGDGVFVTKRGKPIGITMPLVDDLFSMGVRKAIALGMYKNDQISMGKMAELMGISKLEAIKILSTLGIDWIDTSVDEVNGELETLKSIL